MKIDSKENHFLPIVADSTQKKFTLLVVTISLIVFLIIFLITIFFVPLIYLQVMGTPNCPTTLIGYRDFCHLYSFESFTPWISNVYGLNKTNTLIMLGTNLVPHNNLQQSSSFIRFEFRS